MDNDWTAVNGESNSSTVFNRLSELIEYLIKDNAFSLINGEVDGVAMLIVAQLAHEYGMVPTDKTYDALNIIRLRKN